MGRKTTGRIRYEGYNDGEFIWGRGALDMKNHLISVMEAVETLLEEGFEPERDVYLLFGMMRRSSRPKLPVQGR